MKPEFLAAFKKLQEDFDYNLTLLQGRDKELARCEATIEELQHLLRRRNFDLQCSSDEYEMKLKKLASSIDEVQEELRTKLQAEREKFQQSLDLKQKEFLGIHDSVRGESASLRKALEKSQQLCTDMASNHGGTAAENQQLKAENEALKDSAQELEAKLQKSRRDLSLSQSQLAEFEQTVESMSQELSDTRARQTRDRVEKDRMEDDLSQVRLELDSVRARLGETISDVNCSREALSAAHRRCDVLQSAGQEAEVRFRAELDAEKRELLQKIRQLEKEKAKQLEAAEQERLELAQKVDALQEELSTAALREKNALLSLEAEKEKMQAVSPAKQTPTATKPTQSLVSPAFSEEGDEAPFALTWLNQVGETLKDANPISPLRAVPLAPVDAQFSAPFPPEARPAPPVVAFPEMDRLKAENGRLSEALKDMRIELQTLSVEHETEMGEVEARHEEALLAKEGEFGELLAERDALLEQNIRRAAELRQAEEDTGVAVEQAVEKANATFEAFLASLASKSAFPKPNPRPSTLATDTFDAPLPECVGKTAGFHGESKLKRKMSERELESQRKVGDRLRQKQQERKRIQEGALLRFQQWKEAQRDR